MITARPQQSGLLLWVLFKHTNKQTNKNNNNQCNAAKGLYQALLITLYSFQFEIVNTANWESFFPVNLFIYLFIYLLLQLSIIFTTITTISISFFFDYSVFILPGKTANWTGYKLVYIIGESDSTSYCRGLQKMRDFAVKVLLILSASWTWRLRISKLGRVRQ